jgi:hypothetical protein
MIEKEIPVASLNDAGLVSSVTLEKVTELMVGGTAVLVYPYQGKDKDGDPLGWGLLSYKESSFPTIFVRGEDILSSWYGPPLRADLEKILSLLERSDCSFPEGITISPKKIGEFVQSANHLVCGFYKNSLEAICPKGIKNCGI